MTPLHLLSTPAPGDAPLPALTRRHGPSVFSGLILAFILLALLLQASFLVGLATGRGAGPGPGTASRPALVR